MRECYSEIDAESERSSMVSVTRSMSATGPQKASGTSSSTTDSIRSSTETELLSNQTMRTKFT